MPIALVRLQPNHKLGANKAVGAEVVVLGVPQLTQQVTALAIAVVDADWDPEDKSPVSEYFSLRVGRLNQITLEKRKSRRRDYQQWIQSVRFTARWSGRRSISEILNFLIKDP